MDALEEQAGTVPPNQEAPARRNKVRKGTRSCWECKRRKIRCIFASPEADTCIGCHRRRVPCVSQDLPEDLAPAKIGNRHLSERLARVEDVMRNLLAENHLRATGRLPGDPRHDGQFPRLATTNACASEPAQPPLPALLTFAESVSQSTPSSTHLTPDSQASLDQSEIEIRALRHLFAAFPAEDDAKILLQASSRPALYTYLVNTQPHSKLTHETLAAPYPLAGLLGPNIHPVNLARMMLIFAITLQSPCGENVVGLSESSSVLMSRLVTAATTWVTMEEQMHGTFECLVCIVLEGVFKTNSGNIRQAWSVYRRAMTVAQMMGLHRTPMPPLKRVDPDFDADPGFLWFRIIYMDRYLSLLLGLPQGSPDKSMGAPSALQYETPLGAFERQLTVIASRVLERNESVFDSTDITTTQSIDSDLLGVSRRMPASFWRPTNFLQLVPGSPDALLETVRLAAQVYYYGLSIQVHLPYMMHGIDLNTNQGYSLLTCVNASREIMTRFISHRTFNPMSSCSRPVDFFALLAAMTLLLAHLDAHQCQGATNFLAHQRLSDRAILEQALEKMDVMSRVNNDSTTEQSAKLIRHLLRLEADAAEGSSYTTVSVGENEESEQDGVEKNSEQIRLHIPYLGVIKIARQGPIARALSVEHPATIQHHNTHMEPSPRRRSSTAMYNTLASIPIQSPANEQQTPDQMSVSTQECTFSNAQFQPPGYYKQCMAQYSNSLQENDYTLQANAELPSIAAGIDDWSLQGVDMAFFDTLMRATPSVENAHSSSNMYT